MNFWRKVGNFLGDAFDAGISLVLFLISGIFLLVAFFVGVDRIGSDVPYYLPFIIVPLLVLFLPFLFRDRESK